MNDTHSTDLPSFATYLHQMMPRPGQPQLGCALAIGVFDGVHRGHQMLLKKAAAVAGEQGLEASALTFDPHPASVFSPSRTPPLLGTLAERAGLLHDAGAISVIVARFDRQFAALTPDEFIKEVLVSGLNSHAIVVGEDFRFGCDRSGTVESLARAGQIHGFTVHAVAPVFVSGIPARSTTIRQMIGGGQVAEAAHLLGRAYTLSGTVVKGQQLGRTLGYPTANLASDPQVLVPAPGVYAGRVHLPDGSIWPSAISIGTNPTVTPDSQTRTVEAFLMRFSGDLYGQSIRVEFVSYLRPTLKFDGLPTLVAQMAHDVEAAHTALSSVQYPSFL